MPRTRKTVDEERVELAEGEAEALQLKIEGHSYQEIADAQGTGKTTAYRRVHNALAEITLAPATELKSLEAQRLEALIKALWPVATDPDHKDHARQVEAVRELRKLSESLRKLHGLDAPSRRSIEVFEHDAFSVMVGRLEAELAMNDPRRADVGS